MIILLLLIALIILSSLGFLIYKIGIRHGTDVSEFAINKKIDEYKDSLRKEVVLELENDKKAKSD